MWITFLSLMKTHYFYKQLYICLEYILMKRCWFYLCIIYFKFFLNVRRIFSLNHPSFQCCVLLHFSRRGSFPRAIHVLRYSKCNNVIGLRGKYSCTLNYQRFPRLVCVLALLTVARISREPPEGALVSVAFYDLSSDSTVGWGIPSGCVL